MAPNATNVYVDADIPISRIICLIETAALRARRKTTVMRSESTQFRIWQKLSHQFGGELFEFTAATNLIVRFRKKSRIKKHSRECIVLHSRLFPFISSLSTNMYIFLAFIIGEGRREVIYLCASAADQIMALLFILTLSLCPHRVLAEREKQFIKKKKRSDLLIICEQTIALFT